MNPKLLTVSWVVKVNDRVLCKGSGVQRECGSLSKSSSKHNLCLYNGEVIIQDSTGLSFLHYKIVFLHIL